MFAPVIQKVIFSPKVFVERRLPSTGSGSKGGKFFVKKGSKVRPFDFVGEVITTDKGAKRLRVTAGVPGEVVKILPGKAILIQTSAVVIRGIAGGGEESEGEIKIAVGCNQPIVPGVVDARGEGQILVGGYVPSLEVFKKAEAVGVRGIICGGADFAAFAKTELPVLVVEGFGKVPLNRRVFDFLESVEGRYVFLSPPRRELLVARHLNHDEDRLELFDAQSEEVTETFAELKKGLEVQVFTSAHFGQMGKVERVLKETVVVSLENGEKIEVPGRNVGILS